MEVILDTNGLSAMADGAVGLHAALKAVPGLAIPTIVLGEYRYGIRQSRSRASYERWLERLMANCRVLVVDNTTATEYAKN